jgi:transcriptional regulator with XRE-family HTH domain
MTTSPRDSTAIDRFVGNRIKTQREALGLSQEKLADALKISFQQVQKYERGFNRVGASRLFALATALNVSISYFFEGLENQS